MFVTIKMALTGVACPDAGKIACVLGGCQALVD